MAESVRRIFVIDDDPPILRALERTLRRTGVEILVFQSPLKALAAMASQAPDVVLTDYNMPEMNGGQVLQRVAAAHPSALRVLLTANANFLTPDDRAIAHEVLPKPWNLDALQKAIQPR
jgi:DNA-binding NtrC family response regulator